jgi:hypothetical protein
MTPGDPYYLNPREHRRLSRRSGGIILSVLGVAFLALIAGVIYVTSPGEPSVTAAPPRLTAPTTTGQGDRSQPPAKPAPLVLPADPSFPADWK